MHKFIYILLLFAIVSIRCGENCQLGPATNNSMTDRSDTLKKEKINVTLGEGLLLTEYKSLGELESVVRITYFKDSSGVCLSSACHGHEVTMN